MSVKGEADYLRRSMLAGAREFLVKPFSSDELTASIRQVYAREKEKLSRISLTPMMAGAAAHAAAPESASGEGLLVPVFSPKGGVGRTTLAVNMAVAASTELNQRVVVRDGSFPFGDGGVVPNLRPRG